MLCGLALAAVASTPAQAGSGGAFATDPAAITDISCVSGCPSVKAVQPGSVLRIRGANMREVGKIVFLGDGGHADNAIVAVMRARVKSVDVTVPANASSGRLRAINVDGSRSAPSRIVVSIVRKAVSSALLELNVVGQRVFVDAARPARVDLLARQPMSVVIALVRVADGAVVMGFPVGALVPGVVRSVTWDGKVAGVVQPAGRYEFRVFNEVSGAQAAEAPTTLATGSFDLVDHIFPVRAKHTFGDGQAAFGASRDGHVHQGQDVFAACGTPLIAARGGVVKISAREARAGNYLVIDGEGSDLDYAYMHLREPSALKAGDVVLTGQPIGNVGDTGDAVGCHLHFELWSGPWQAGGAPMDPLPALQAWDSYS